ncbi:MAG TPA: RT0821/Lpp0805 family surface protein [Aliidongia sp.]|nr:RT0821/Lpp0805 family surface protein [Aliidongia sp.]
MKPTAFAALSAMLILTGCYTPGPGQPGYAPPGTFGANNTTGGTLLGAGAGALIGNQFGKGGGRVATTILGGVLGAFAGNAIGRGIDENDLAYANQASQRAFASGQPVQWQNPNNGNYGTIVPQQSYQQGGTQCRSFQQTIVVDGQQTPANGVACQQPDGTWKVQG